MGLFIQLAILNGYSWWVLYFLQLWTNSQLGLVTCLYIDHGGVGVGVVKSSCTIPIANNHKAESKSLFDTTLRYF